MRPPTGKQKSLYTFLKKQDGKPFALQALVAATGYGVVSAQSALCKHWAAVAERYETATERQWRTSANFAAMSLDEFHRAISQTRHGSRLGRLQHERAVALARISHAQAHVALELLNRPGLESRVECFLLLLLNAWELLLKAEVVERNGWEAVFLPAKPGKRRRSLSFDTLVMNLPSATNAEMGLQAQLRRLHDLRNEAAHLLVSRPSRNMLYLFAGSLRTLSKRFETVTGTRLFAAADVAGYLVLVGLADTAGAAAADAVAAQLDETIAVEHSQGGFLKRLWVQRWNAPREVSKHSQGGPGNTTHEWR